MNYHNDEQLDGIARDGLQKHQRAAYLQLLGLALEVVADSNGPDRDSELVTVLGPVLGVLRTRLGLPDLDVYLGL